MTRPRPSPEAWAPQKRKTPRLPQMSQGTVQKLRHYRVEGCIMSKSNSPESDDRPNLRVVSSPEAEVYDLMRAPETTAERVKRLQAEARALALEQVEALEEVLLKAADMAREIAEGGDAYPVGARELAQRLGQDLPVKAETMKAIIAKSHP